MRNRIAERILSLAVPQEQARTILGDLLEAQLNSVAFWRAVLTTTASTAWHAPARAALRMFLFAAECCFYGSMVWMTGHPQYAVGAGLTVGSTYLLIGLLVRVVPGLRKHGVTPSVLPFFLYFYWSWRYAIGLSVGASVSISVALITVFFVIGHGAAWLRRRNSTQNTVPPDDRPVAQ